MADGLLQVPGIITGGARIKPVTVGSTLLFNRLKPPKVFSFVQNTGPALLDRRSKGYARIFVRLFHHGLG